MGSRAVDWKDMTARTTKVGEVRQVFENRTATLDELELHITTLQPGPDAASRRTSIPTRKC